MANRYSQEFKDKVIADVEAGLTKGEAADKYNVSSSAVNTWLIEKYGKDETRRLFGVFFPEGYRDDFKVEIARKYRSGAATVDELADQYELNPGTVNWIGRIFKTPEEREAEEALRKQRREEREKEQHEAWLARQAELEERDRLRRQKQEEEDRRKREEEKRYKAWLAERQEKIDADPMLSLMQELVQEVQKLNVQLDSLETSVWGVAAEIEKQSKWQWKSHKDLREDLQGIAKEIPDFMSVEMC